MLCKVPNPVGGGRRISQQIRELIFQMVADNPSWGAPRIHGELLMLGFDVSETTISRWMKRAPKDPQPAKRWLAFLRNHREAIAAMDFFTVPTLTFGVLYCFFIIGHDRRRILHFNVTRHPTSSWIVADDLSVVDQLATSKSQFEDVGSVSQPEISMSFEKLGRCDSASQQFLQHAD